MYVSNSTCNIPILRGKQNKTERCLAKIQIKLASIVLPDGLPGGAVVKNLPCQAGDSSLIPGLKRFPRVGNGNPLPYFCLENPMDRGTWQATVNEGPKSQTQLSIYKCGFYPTDLSSESP